MNHEPKKIIEVRPNGRKRVLTVFEGESLAEQQFKDDCDVNIIMDRFLKTGHIGHLKLRDEGVYADLTEMPVDYHEAMTTVVAAQTAFEQLPADVRLRFQNDPGAMLEFLKDPKNQKEAIELGLMTPKPSDTQQMMAESLNEINQKLSSQKAEASAPEPQPGSKKK